MCLILFSFLQHPEYPLILAGNRDEFYDRPSLPADFWPDSPDILAGRDSKHGGTWLGITRSRRFAALTNYRDPAANQPDALSRGLLVSDYLSGRMLPDEYIKAIRTDAVRYNGFNLLLGDSRNLWHYSNRSNAVSVLKPGVYGISNHLLDTPWPKVQRGKMLLTQAVTEPVKEQDLLALLQDDLRPPDELLPKTGVSLEWERTLSPIFVTSPDYGTRAMTVVCVRRDGRISFTERSRQDTGEWTMRTYQW